MKEVKREFNERKKEVENYFNFLIKIIQNDAKILFDDTTKERISVGLTTTMKSGGVLLLYNLVESTVTNLLELIHRTFSEENLLYDQLSESIQKLWFQFYYSNIKSNNIGDDNILSKIKMIHDSLSSNKPIHFTFDEYTRYKNGSIFAGNLDARSIKKIFKQYDIDINYTAPELKAVKELRNKLAHGEISFSNCTKDMVPNYFNKLKEETLIFLEKLIETVNEYLSKGLYRRA